MEQSQWKAREMFLLIYLRVPTEAAHGHVLGLLNKFEPNNENFGKR